MTTLMQDRDSEPAVGRDGEIGRLTFDAQQARLLHERSQEVAAAGGPQARGAKALASQAATELKLSLSAEQAGLLGRYAAGLMSVLVFDGLRKVTDAPPPAALPAPADLEGRADVLCLASRSQILLKLAGQRAFAYDIDNDGKLVRLVANFKGGGAQRLGEEPGKVEVSSHSGLLLGPHTEAPYWCAVKAENGHSPAPSTLILTALWNPGGEPTSVIPLPPILDRLGATGTLALSSRSFDFTRSDSFVDGKGEDGRGVSIIDFDAGAGFAARFNSYRFSVAAGASPFVRRAYGDFCQAVGDAVPHQSVLTQECAIVINNNRALHCRDTVRDNRRLLLRIFGFSRAAQPIAISDDPLLVRG
jgi:hypothetical protein